jgi:hypothetical protein
MAMPEMKTIPHKIAAKSIVDSKVEACGIPLVIGNASVGWVREPAAGACRPWPDVGPGCGTRAFGTDALSGTSAFGKVPGELFASSVGETLLVAVLDRLSADIRGLPTASGTGGRADVAGGGFGGVSA